MLFWGESNYHCLMMGLFCSMRFRWIPFPGSDFMIRVVGGTLLVLRYSHKVIEAHHSSRGKICPCKKVDICMYLYV